MKKLFTFLMVMLTTAVGVFAETKYTELEYIECTGGRRENAFVTDYVPSTPTTIGIGFQQTGDNNWAAIFCARNTHAGSGISLYANGDNTHLGYFTGGTTGAGDNFVEGYDNRARYDVVANTAMLKWTKQGGTEQSKETGNSEMNATDRCLSIFANPEWDNAFKGRIFYLNISDGAVEYAYKPVMRHDGVYGFLDATSGKFVTPREGNYANYTYGVKSDKPIVTISTTSVSLKEGEKATVTAEGGFSYTWKTSDASVATVDNGVITGVTDGDCTITCTTSDLGGWEFTIKVSVRGDVEYSVWDGSSDAVLPSIRHNGDAGKAAYTKVFDSGMGYNDAYFNQVWGTPDADGEGKQWFEAGYSVEGWNYNTTVLPQGWPENMGEVYARRYFKAKGDLTGKTVYMPAPHDDAPCEYYINGTLVWARTGYEPNVNGWEEAEVVRLTEDQKALIKTDGSINVFAFHVHQNWG
ncbi:MAG: Ig-like domain-containing protein, partial [Bacteroidaceae bacterium]|nr:Ig-like domain-containing protein [Bacteroidaceae bacterium]